jgi:hypothetical protein
MSHKGITMDNNDLFMDQSLSVLHAPESKHAGASRH